MATVHRCDKCNNVIDRYQSISINLLDLAGFFGKPISRDVELCKECAEKSRDYLGKIFPNLIIG